MLTDIQKQAVRLLIENKPNAEYMAAMASDDDFVLNEIATHGAELLRLKQEVKINLINQKEAIEKTLEKLDNDITTLTGVLC